MKRVVRRPWGRKQKGGWIIQPSELLQALKDGDTAEFGKIQVGAKQLRQLLDCMSYPDEEFLVTNNGHLEVSNIKRILVTRNGQRRTAFRKPKLHHSFRVSNNAWLTGKKVTTTLVIRPRKF